MMKLLKGVEKAVIFKPQEDTLFCHCLAVKQRCLEKGFTLFLQSARVLRELSQPFILAQNGIVHTGSFGILLFLLLLGRMLFSVL